MVSVAKVGPAPAADYLPDGEGGSLEGERIESLDKRLEKFIKAKLKIGELRETMKKAKEEMIAIGLQENVVTYRAPVEGDVYQLDLVEETRAKIAKANTPK